MPLEYTISYSAENVYDSLVKEAFWQFLILPEANATQQMKSWSFSNSLGENYHVSTNGLGFMTFQVRPKSPFKRIEFEMQCQMHKTKVNPFDFEPNQDIQQVHKLVTLLNFKLAHEPYLRETVFTKLPEKQKKIVVFDTSISIFDNLQKLNHWVYNHVYFKTGVTNVHTQLEEIIDKRHGVCQDFTHLFCAIARANNIPARYVSGYIHQGNNYFGDLQMHAWAEVYVPNIGWMGFDPTNDLLVAENHIKVAHGKDYNDCSPLKGVVYAEGSNETNYSVKVQSAQQQQ